MSSQRSENSPDRELKGEQLIQIARDTVIALEDILDRLESFMGEEHKDEH